MKYTVVYTTSFIIMSQQRGVRYATVRRQKENTAIVPGESYAVFASAGRSSSHDGQSDLPYHAGRGGAVYQKPLRASGYSASAFRRSHPSRRGETASPQRPCSD